MASRRSNSPTYPLLSRPSSPRDNDDQKLPCTPLPTLPNITIDHTNISKNWRWGHYIVSLVFAMGSVSLLLMLRDTTLSAISTDGASSPSDSTSNGNINNTTEGVLDFAIVGFEKTGTTFLLSALGSHPEVTMPIKHSELSKRICTKREHGLPTLVDWLNGGDEKENSSRSLISSNLKHGIKCSDLIVQKTLAIERMAEISDQTKLIIGVRHPVLWYQSLYNYRVRQSYDLNWTRPIPTPHDLYGTKQWKGVSILSAKFETYLQQLAKVPMSKDDVVGMTNNDLDIRISPNPFKVFIYTIEQLEDASRLLQFENDIQTYLNLQSPLKHFASKPKENVNSASYPEFIDICDEKYESLRDTLIEQGTSSSLWIREKFIKSKDVVVSDEQYFDSILRSWSVDPCDNDDEVKEGREEDEY